MKSIWSNTIYFPVQCYQVQSILRINLRFYWKVDCVTHKPTGKQNGIFASLEDGKKETISSSINQTSDRPWSHDYKTLWTSLNMSWIIHSLAIILKDIWYSHYKYKLIFCCISNLAPMKNPSQALFELISINQPKSILSGRGC